jgi:hypothetical protein
MPGGMRGRVFENMKLSPEDAQRAARNVATLNTAFDDPNRTLNRQLTQAEWYADPSQSASDWRLTRAAWTTKRTNAAWRTV